MHANVCFTEKAHRFAGKAGSTGFQAPDISAFFIEWKYFHANVTVKLYHYTFRSESNTHLAYVIVVLTCKEKKINL